MKQNLSKLFQLYIGLKNNAVWAIIIVNLTLAALALLKDIFLASYLGTSIQADSFWLAFFVPDMVGNNLLFSSLGIACIPLFSKIYINDSKNRMERVGVDFILFFTFIAAGLSLAFYLTGTTIIYRLGPGLSRNALEQSVLLMTMMLPLIIFAPFISIGTAMSQVKNSFVLPALAPVVFNLVFGTAVLYTYLLSIPIQSGVFILAAAISVGSMMMVLLIWYATFKHRVRRRAWLRFSLGSSTGYILEVCKILLPYLLIVLSTQGVYVVERHLASHLGVGSIAGLNYAFRIAQFPSWVFVAAISTVVFPSISKAISSGKMEKLKEAFGKSLCLVILITLPLSIYIFTLRLPIVTILFQRGSFDMNSVQITAGILAGYSLTIVAQGVTVICLRVFLAADKVFMALLSVMAASVLNIFLDYIFINYFGSAGLGYGAAIGAMVNAGILFYLLNRTMGLGLGKHSRSFMKIMAANLLLLPLAYIFYLAWRFIGSPGVIKIRVVYALSIIAVSFPAYLMVLRLLKIGVKDILQNQAHWEVL